MSGIRTVLVGVVALVELAQLQQPVDQALQALALLHHLRGKHAAVGGGQLVLQQLATNGVGADAMSGGNGA